MRAVRLSAVLTGLLAVAVAPGQSQEAGARSGAGEPHRFALELEAGPVWQTRNDVQVPNDETGTRFSLRDVTGSGPWPAARVYLTWRVGGRHALRGMAAPLSISETGRLPRPVDFAGASYGPELPARATYTFDSYRLSYIYRLHRGQSWTWDLGVTAKIRDAVVELEQAGTSSRKTDVGFVPLLHVAADWRFAPRWHAQLDADALAGGPGRAEDVSLEAGYDLGEDWTVSAGYRTLEGGADVDEVFAFAWLHYAVASLEYRF